MKRITAQYRFNKVKTYIGSGLFNKIRLFLPDGKIFVITDENVAKLYLDALKRIIPEASIYIVGAGDSYKTLTTAETIVSRLINLGFTKTDTILGFGGGMITDLSGFVAATYKRGCDFIAMPTSLLAQVDSALGGKCAVNCGKYKNQIGTYYHPRFIVVDPDFIKTLPEEEYLSGLAEIIKYGLVFDRSFFNLLFSDFSLSEVIYRSLKIKAQITAQDEFDEKERVLLNYGHTIGHAIESLSEFKVKHGIAVAVGMYYETKDEKIKHRLLKLYNHLGIGVDIPFSREAILTYVCQDKKLSGKMIRLPVLEDIGKAQIVNISVEEFMREIL
ncbi:MAG: 3-dehydroquinate synthase [Bacilli bacterium]|nr:3-dehydroquinate synthase [Bacilli bacterium]MDD4077535.1 3-dehydroquinate synthase [Bacilli bacterium]